MQALIDSVPQLFTGLEVGHKLTIKTYRLAGFRISSDPGRTIMKGEATKSPNLNSLTVGQ